MTRSVRRTLRASCTAGSSITGPTVATNRSVSSATARAQAPTTVTTSDSTVRNTNETGETPPQLPASRFTAKRGAATRAELHRRIGLDPAAALACDPPILIAHVRPLPSGGAPTGGPRLIMVARPTGGFTQMARTCRSATGLREAGCRLRSTGFERRFKMTQQQGNRYDADRRRRGPQRPGRRRAAWPSAAHARVVLEKRHKTGGAADTSEPWPDEYPGVKVNTLSYTMSLMPPSLRRELQLERFGFKLLPLGQGYMPMRGGGSIIQADDDAEDPRLDREALQARRRRVLRVLRVDLPHLRHPRTDADGDPAPRGLQEGRPTCGTSASSRGSCAPTSTRPRWATSRACSR